MILLARFIIDQGRIQEISYNESALGNIRVNLVGS